MDDKPIGKTEIEILVKRPSPFSAVLIAFFNGDDLAEASDDKLAFIILQTLAEAIKRAQEANGNERDWRPND